MESPPTRVVVVDSHPVVRYGLIAILQSQPGIVVIGAAVDGLEALTLILTAQPNVAILDLFLPQLSGIDVMQQARLNAVPTRFLVLTDSSDDTHLHGALDAGAHGYMFKAAEPDELLRAVRVLAYGGAVLEPQIAARLLERVVHGGATDLLSAREQDVLHWLVEGASNRAIANKLTISEHTVRSHVSHIMQKLQAQSRTEAAAIALRHGLVAFPSPTQRAAQSS